MTGVLTGVSAGALEAARGGRHPDGRRIVHHALAFLLQDEEGVTGLASTAIDMETDQPLGPAGLFMEWAVGKVGKIFPAVGEEIVDNQAPARLER